LAVYITSIVGNARCALVVVSGPPPYASQPGQPLLQPEQIHMTSVPQTAAAAPGNQTDICQLSLWICPRL